MNKSSIGILHYSAPPVIGGVESVIKAQVNVFVNEGYSCTVIAGRGSRSALAPDTKFIEVPEIDSNHPAIGQINRELESGVVPDGFAALEKRIAKLLEPAVKNLDTLIVHNVFTKHFNLPLTAALNTLLDKGVIKNCIAWCHDVTWTSPNSKSKVFPGYPWDLLRIKRADCTYVTVSRERQKALAELYDCPLDEIKVIYNGVDPFELLSLSKQGVDLIFRLGMVGRGINILMPVRVTQAKNIEFALQVAAELVKMDRDPLLIVTGPPDPHDIDNMEYYQSLIDLRGQLGLDDHMRFIYNSGPIASQPYYIDERMLGDLYRVSDVMFMPSHREGFGIPVLEAGLVGIPILSREIPAAHELARGETEIFDADASAAEVAALMVELLESSSISRLRRKIRRQFTWRAIFEKEIKPLLP